MRGLGKRACALVLAAGFTAPAWAVRFELPWDMEGSWANSFALGASWRMQERDPGLIGKTNLDPTLCNQSYCLGLQAGPVTAEQQRYIDAPGAYTLNGDDGDLNFNRGDMVAGSSKLTSDLSITKDNFGLFARSYFVFDRVYSNLTEHHPDRAVGDAANTRAPVQEKFPGELVNETGIAAKLMDAYIFGTVPVFGQDVDFRLGNNLVNWGESTFMVVNSINTVNPPLESRIFVPGFDVKDVFQAVPMAFLSTQLTEHLSTQAFYQLKWVGLRTVPPGSFWATSDLGVPGGQFASLPYAANAEDPTQQERLHAPPPAVPDSPSDFVAALDLTRTSLTVLRTADHNPKDMGQYGLGVKWFSEMLGNTEFGFYYMNYHSRLPYASAISAYRGCLRPAGGGQPTQLDAQQCETAGMGLTKQQKYEQGKDLLPADSVQIFLEYPENIQLLGLGFNTNVGDFAIQGEYAYRPNLPVQVDLEDMVDAALHPAFPRQDVDLIALLAGVPVTGCIPGDVCIPGQNTAVPDLIESRYRHNPEVQPRSYVSGYERLKVGQMSTAITYVFGPGNQIGADQIISLLEVGMTNVFDLPSKNQAVFEGPGTNTAPFPGRVETGSDLPINPTQNKSGYVDSFAWGYRVYVQPSYKAIFQLFTYEPTILFMHDVHGTSPGPGGNFIYGRKEIDWLNSFIYQSYRFNLGYAWYLGAGERNLRNDRDYLTASVRYEF